MTTEEFIKKVNLLSEEERNGVFAFSAPGGGMVIATDSTSLRSPNPLWLAHMPIYSNSWSFLEKCIIPGRVLKLMAEFADSKYHECEKKYVILNGKPSGKHWDVFWINKEYQNFDKCSSDDRDGLISHMSYTECELAEAKKHLPEALQKAVDALTVPLDEALKMGEDNDD